ncbi:DUF523 domain-containing protein [Treponema pectinovorum]|uniref:DUF523 domain-containing protein n=1 Tax=Treponema pectinovorum TaxID=164 RepID=UPI0011C7FA3D|nr:DUF523 domain-containing protein [Treponema pectinovorum]
MNILVSACLLGFDVRYDGTNNAHLIPKEKIERLKKMVGIIPICPECFGGLECPRIPCEIKDKKVVDQEGNDKTDFFVRGAMQALKAAKMFNCPYALFKEKSPSCGFGKIYDGSFSHSLKDGSGITAALLAENGLKIFGESQIDFLIEKIRLAKSPNQLSFDF